MNKIGKIKKGDFILLFVIVAVCILCILIFTLTGKNGGSIKIEMSGATVGEYPLSKDARIPVGEHNIVVISDGSAEMQWADCPDLICVHHAPVKKAGQTIVCLPNKVVVTVIGGDTDGPDAVAE